MDFSKVRLKHVGPPKGSTSELGKVISTTTLDKDYSKLKTTTLPAFCFDSTSWTPVKEAPPQKVNKLKILTWNLWIGTQDLADRITGLCKLLAKLKPHIVAFQELTPQHFELLMANEYIRKTYYSTDLTNQYSDYKTALLSTFPFVSFKLIDMPNSPRKMILVEFAINGNKLDVASVHLQSEGGAQDIRQGQLEYLNTMLHTEQSALIMGDFNMQSEKESKCYEDMKFRDLWKSLQPNDKGYTMDATVNVHAQLTTAPSYRRRLDRMILRSDKWKEKKISIVGKDPLIKNKLWISDHFGLFAKLQYI